MQLKDTIKLITSSDYKERFRGEYFELTTRIAGLTVMLEKLRGGILPFTPKCSYDLLNGQLKAMHLYANYLEERAAIEDIDLFNEEVK